MAIRELLGSRAVGGGKKNAFPFVDLSYTEETGQIKQGDRSRFAFTNH